MLGKSINGDKDIDKTKRVVITMLGRYSTSVSVNKKARTTKEKMLRVVKKKKRINSFHQKGKR